MQEAGEYGDGLVKYAHNTGSPLARCNYNGFVVARSLLATLKRSFLRDRRFSVLRQARADAIDQHVGLRLVQEQRRFHETHTERVGRIT